MSDDLRAEHRDAATLARAAGEALLGLRRDPPAHQDLGSAGDRLAHAFLVAELGRLYPGDAIRSEEGLEHVAGEGRLWIVDPLDGTREFRQRDRADWAVHVALAVGGRPVVGAVALPALDLVLSTGQRPMPTPRHQGAPRVVVSRSRPPDQAYEVTAAIGGVMVPMGSAGAKIAAVVLGQAEVYVHAGGQYEWDSCAPVAVALAAGLHASRLDGASLRYGQSDAWLPDLVVCRPEYAQAVLEVTRDHRGTSPR